MYFSPCYRFNFLSFAKVFILSFLISVVFNWGSTVSGWLDFRSFFRKTVFGWSTFSIGLTPGGNSWKSMGCLFRGQFVELPRLNRNGWKNFLSRKVIQSYQSSCGWNGWSKYNTALISYFSPSTKFWELTCKLLKKLSVTCCRLREKQFCLSQLLEIKFTNHDVALCDAILRVTQISTFDSFYIRLETGIRRICIWALVDSDFSYSWQVILGAHSEVILVAYWTANSSVTWSSLWVK